MRVQLLEPDVHIRDRLHALLCRSGHDVEVAVDFGTSRELLGSSRASLIFVNVDDPEFQGRELVRQAREQARAEAPLIAGLTRADSDCGGALADEELDDLIVVDLAESIVASRLGFLERRVNRHRRLVASEARFHALIQHSSDVLVIVDPDGVITWMSPSVERILGRKIEERIGRSVYEYVLPEDQASARAVHARALDRPGQVQSALIHVRAVNGSVRAILFAITNLLDSEVGGIALNGRDLTETLETQERLRQSQEYVRVALDSAGMAAWRYDVAREKIVWTPETAAIFGLPEVETQISVSDAVGMIHPDDRHFFDAASMARRLDEGQLNLEFRAIWPDGSVHWLEVKGRPSFSGRSGPEMIAGVVFEITARKQIEANLHAERAILEILLNNGPDAIYIKDRDSRFVRVNTAVAVHFGFSETVDLIGKTDFDLFPEEEARRYFLDEQRVMEFGETVVNRLDRHVRDGGGDMWILTSLAPIRNERGATIGVIGTSRDVTHYSLDDRQLAIAEMRYRLVVEQIPAITCLYSIKNGVQGYEYISPQVTEILGYTPQEYAEEWAAEPTSFFHPDDLERITAEMERINTTHAPATVVYRHRVKSGGWKWVRELASPIPGDDPGHHRWQGILFDLTEDRALTERLEHQVFHDPLTGLPNRLMLSQRLDQVSAKSERSKRAFALLFIDLDEFKHVNDTKGHHAGDAALIAVAERLRKLTRAGDTVARLSGDEFVILLAEISGPRSAHEIAARVQRAFKEPFVIDGQSIALSPSIGVSVRDLRQPSARRDSPNDLLREADAAMYEAKRAGRGRTRVFDVETRAPALARRR